NNNITRPADYFIINDEKYFSSADQFANLSILSGDSLSPHFQALLLYQALTKFHLQDKSPEALADVDLQRLTFVYRHSVLEKKMEVYEKAILQYVDKFKHHELSAEANYLLAEYYRNLGNQYNKADTSNQFALIKAIDFARKAMIDYPKSAGGIKAENLIN